MPTSLKPCKWKGCATYCQDELPYLIKTNCALFCKLKTENINRNADPTGGRLTMFHKFILSICLIYRVWAGYTAAQLEFSFCTVPCSLAWPYSNVPTNGI